MQEKNNFFYKLSSFILNYKPMFIILFVCLSIGSIFTLDKATIESDLSNYLEPTSLTRKGLVVFEEEFAQLVSADLMLKNISYDDSLVAYNQISQTDGVLQVTFDETKYKEDNALYKINFDSEFSENSDIVEILTNINEDITNNFSDTQVIINSSVYNNDEEDLNAEMTMILGLAVIIISLILVFTSKSFAEIPILLCVFGVAALINKGTNFVFYDISFISDSIGVILQLALAIDYALILLHRYTEERELNDPNEACKIALSKAIPEISASSLTTVCGLIALSYMTYRLGFDMSKVLIKSIFISLFCVFTLLPSLLVIFDKAIQKTTHKNFVPSIANLCNASLKSTKIVLPLFLIVTALAYTYADKAEYFFYEGTSDLDTESPSYQINSVFGQSNDLAIIVPSRSSTLIDKFAVDLYKLPQVDSITSFSTIEIAEGVTLDTPINYMQATQLVGVDAETAYMIFANFAGSIGEAEDYVNISDTYTIPVIDLIYFLYNMKDSGAVPEELIPNIVEQVTMIDTLKDSLTTENFHMILVSLNTTVESEQTFDFLHKLSPIASRYFYQYYLVGECVSSYELSNAFQ
ncbi:MAG: MMPL family transporter, partial [bacterium]